MTRKSDELKNGFRSELNDLFTKYNVKEDTPHFEFLNIIDKFPIQQKMDIMEVMAKAKLQDDDAIFTFLYVMGYIQTMYKEIPESLKGLTDQLQAITQDTTKNLEDNVKDVVTNISSEMNDNFKQMVSEQTRLNEATAKSTDEFETKITQSIDEIVSQLGNNFDHSLAEQKQLNEDLKESAKIYQIGISMSNKQIQLAIEKQKVKIVEIFIEALKKDLPKIMEQNIKRFLREKNQNETNFFSIKSFFFTTGAITVALLLNNILSHIIGK